MVYQSSGSVSTVVDRLTDQWISRTLSRVIRCQGSLVPEVTEERGNVVIFSIKYNVFPSFPRSSPILVPLSPGLVAPPDTPNEPLDFDDEESDDQNFFDIIRDDEEAEERSEPR